MMSDGVITDLGNELRREVGSGGRVQIFDDLALDTAKYQQRVLLARLAVLEGFIDRREEKPEVGADYFS